MQRLVPQNIKNMITWFFFWFSHILCADNGHQTNVLFSICNVLSFIFLVLSLMWFYCLCCALKWCLQIVSCWVQSVREMYLLNFPSLIKYWRIICSKKRLSAPTSFQITEVMHVPSFKKWITVFILHVYFVLELSTR